MKKVFCILSAALLSCGVILAQSPELKQCFKDLNSFLKEYKIGYYRDSYHIQSKNMSVSFSYPYLTLSFTDVLEDGYYPSNGVILGNKRFKMDIRHTTFDGSTKTNSFTSFTWTDLRIKDADGIEKTESGRKELISSFSLEGTPLTLKKADELFNNFKDKVLAEGFTGNLPAVSSSGSSRSSSTSTTFSLPNKYNAARFSISYPSGWSYLENVQGADVYIGANDGSIAFSIFSFYTSYTLEEVMKEADANATLAGWKKTNVSTTLCGVRCHKSTITYTYNGKSVKQISYTLKKNGYVYNLRFGNDAAAVNANSSLISSIANSFKIK